MAAVSIVDELRNHIAESGLSAYRISRDTGVGQAVLSRFLNRKRDITFATAAKLAHYFDLHLEKKC